MARARQSSGKNQKNYRKTWVSATNRLEQSLSKEIQSGAGGGAGRQGGKRHSPEGPALFCSKLETFKKSQTSAASWFFGVLLLLVKEKRKKFQHFHEQMRNFERKQK